MIESPKMAYYNETVARDAGLLARALSGIAGWLSHAAREMQRRRMVRITYAELSALSDRELDDMGLSRADLRRVSLEAVGTNA